MDTTINSYIQIYFDCHLFSGHGKRIVHPSVLVGAEAADFPGSWDMGHSLGTRSRISYQERVRRQPSTTGHIHITIHVRRLSSIFCLHRSKFLLNLGLQKP